MLPAAMRAKVGEQIPWTAYRDAQVFESASHDTFKALLKLDDGRAVETVLMANARSGWTVCVSTQVGCAMACIFCATGHMGFRRNLTRDEITDQYRFWQDYLKERRGLGRITNMVLMGMGEPLANMDEVQAALHTWLTSTPLGPTRITVSTVGLLTPLEHILKDPGWPRVRMAVSLHSAVRGTHARLVPTGPENFLPKIQDWARRYVRRHGNRRHHLTFEYVMLKGINDSLEEAEALARFTLPIGRVRINLIPYNAIPREAIESSLPAQIRNFADHLKERGLQVTLRKTMGDDIQAACGQLVTGVLKPLDKSESRAL